MRTNVKRVFKHIILLNLLFLIIYLISQLNIWKETSYNLKEQHVQNATPKYHVSQGTMSPKSEKSSCPGIRYPASLSKGDTWYGVDDMKHAYVFSAYHDEKEPSVLSIIGVFTGQQRYVCQLWYKSANNEVSLRETNALINAYGEDHLRRYAACNFKCELPSKDIPTTVSLVTKSCQTPINLIPVKTIRQPKYERNFTVCLKPLNFKYGRAYELVEWIEVQRILGAEKILIYNYSSAAIVVKVLDEYIKEGLVQVIQWRLPMNVHQWPPTKETVEIHGFGLVAAVNDCLFRIREKSRFLVFVDVDEFIIPRSSSSLNWNDMMSELPKHNAYYFSNVFFRKEWDNTENTFYRKSTAEKYNLVTLLKTKKEETIWIPPARSKYIARTDSVVDLGNHHVSKMHTQPYVVPVHIGLLHHYRNWQNYEDKQKQIIDKTMVDKYKDRIIDNVSKIWLKLKDVELDIPII